MILIHFKPEIEWPKRCSSRGPLCELRDALGGHDGGSVQMHLEATTMPAWRPWSSQFGDAYWDHQCVTLEGAINGVWRYTGRPWSSAYGDQLQDCNRVSLEIQWDAVMEPHWRYTGRPWSTEWRDALQGGDWPSVGMHFQALIEWDWRSTWIWSIGRQTIGGIPGVETLFISYWTHTCGNVKLSSRAVWWWSIGSEAHHKLKLFSGIITLLGDRMEDRQSWMDAVLSVYYFWCSHIIMARRDREGCSKCVLQWW